MSGQERFLHGRWSSFRRVCEVVSPHTLCETKRVCGARFPGNIVQLSLLHSLHYASEATHLVLDIARPLARYPYCSLSSFSPSRPSASTAPPVIWPPRILSRSIFAPKPPRGEEVVSAPDPDKRRNSWELEAIGLKIKPVEVPTWILVIDHFERPSEN
jgi:hypothetical protein